MKIYRVLISVLALLLAACGSQGGPSGSSNTGVLSLSGTVQAWNSSYGSLIEAFALTDEVLGTGAVDGNGNFRIDIAPPQSYRTTPIGGCLTDVVAPSVIVSPPTLQMNNVNLRLAGVDTSIIALRESPNGTRVVSRLYANQAGTVTGTDTCQDGNIGYNYNMTLQQGWNIVIADILGDSTGQISTIYYTSYPLNADLSGLNYYITVF